MDMHDLLKYLVKEGASDMHLCAGSPPIVRIAGKLVPIDGAALTSQNVETLIYSTLSQEQRHRFEEEHELDCSLGILDVGRFRINVHRQRGTLAVAIRGLPLIIPTVDELMLPQAVKDLSQKKRGLILVTGATGAGKSTTLAAIIEHINTSREAHIVTIEDPIEFIYKNKKSIIKQREIGSDTKSYAMALRHVFRQDPDVILVSELRELEAIEAALSAAETGRLVLGTLHTTDASTTVDRLVDAFPANEQPQVRAMLAATLEGVVSQQLVPRADGRGRVAACEVMVITNAIRNYIRQAKSHQIASDIETGARHGMQTMDQALFALCQKKIVSPQEALLRAKNREALQNQLIHAGILRELPKDTPRAAPAPAKPAPSSPTPKPS